MNCQSWDNNGKQLTVRGTVTFTKGQHVLVFANGYGDGWYVGDLPAASAYEEESGILYVSTMIMGEIPLTVRVFGTVMEGSAKDRISGATAYKFEYLEGLSKARTGVHTYEVK